MLDFDARLADARTRRHDGDAARAGSAGGAPGTGGDRPMRAPSGWSPSGPAADRRRGGWCAGRSGDDADSPRPSTPSARACTSRLPDDGWRLLVDLPPGRPRPPRRP
jgi:hypothetical protein